MPALRQVLKEKIVQAHGAHRLRAPVPTARESQSAHITFGGKQYISFSCNDYLGLIHHPKLQEAAMQAAQDYGAGAGASRLLTGNHPLYASLEAKLAKFKGTEAACVFGSGYLANIGAIPALVSHGDVIFADRLVHACMLDAARLSGAKLVRFRHNDAEDLQAKLEKHRHAYRHALIATETVFSMDGDVAPMREISALAKQHDAWSMTDNAHGLGAMLDMGGALADVQMGTLSKALGSYGGYICGSKELVEWLQTAARSLLFSTALPPSVIATASAALDILEDEPERCKLPQERARQFTKELGLPEAQSNIVPLLLGEEALALRASDALKEAGFLVMAIRPPTVPEGTARLRFAFSALHAEADIARLCETIRNANWFKEVRRENIGA